METLLTHAFNHLTSPHPPKIRRGLRMLEGLLAQLCLSHPTQTALPITLSPPQPDSASDTSNTSSAKSASSTPTTDPSTTATTKPSPKPKTLASLPSDPAFREFIRLQDGFRNNVTLRLISTLEKLLGKGNSGQGDLLIVGCLELVVGVMLVHGESRGAWGREGEMNLLLDLLDPTLCPAIHVATLRCLTVVCLDHPSNTRLFESLDGLLVVTGLFKTRGVGREVRAGVVDFLYFYLGGETAEDSGSKGKKEGGKAKKAATVDEQVLLGGRGAEVLDAFKREASGGETVGAGRVGLEVGGEESTKTRSRKEKEKMLGRYLDNVGDLVEDMEEGSGLGGAAVGVRMERVGVVSVGA